MIVVASDAYGCFVVVERDAFAAEFVACRRIDAIAYLFTAGGCRAYEIFIGKSLLVYLVFENKLGHRRTAYVSVAHKHYLFHLLFLGVYK